ncbi:hypothetical protein E2562_034852 [Oryza meyeriana var. granulata]|uniref:C3H1-type domain-containing protein n=1 Tax=Oryza meyeriana var. granulata TaxID=110450 RepID=A0A6G1E6I9_9ORYZ|nr:hypothetical protein E2562_034852 [Oryza meyeriana var. granulata]
MEREGSHRRESEDVIVLSPGPPVRRRPPPPPPPPAKAVEVAASAVYEPPEKLFYKTRLCETFVSSGRCMYEDGCTFAHGSEELRPSLTACAGGGSVGGGYRSITKVCFEFRDKGTCHFGETCAFPHVSAAGNSRSFAIA